MAECLERLAAQAFPQPSGDLAEAGFANDGAVGNRASQHPVLNADGRYVAFESYADNLVPITNLAKVQSAYLNMRLTVLNAAVAADPAATEKLLDVLPTLDATLE